MSVQFLNRKETKKALSGQKNKKKSKKNVLALADKLDIRNPELDTGNLTKLSSLLENLLPSANIFQNTAKGNVKCKFEKESEEELLLKNRLKRNQLLLGINVVSKGVKNDIAACVIFANDISPKLMTNHLKLLCCKKQVPYVSVPKFRELTKKTLGFPCIALGIKKDSAYFVPVIEIICSAVKNEKYTEKTYPDNTKIKTEESKDDIKYDTKKNLRPFVYLHRSIQNNERAFVPDSDGEATKTTDKNEDFIALDIGHEKSDNSKEIEKEVTKNISVEQDPGNKNKRKINSSSDPENETDISVEYSMAKVMKLDANPCRESGKIQTMKRMTNTEMM